MNDNDYKRKVGNIIAKQREYLGLSQEKLAEKADLSFQFISAIETGRQSFTITTLNKLCRALHMSADKIVFGEENQTDTQQITALIQTIDEKYLPLAEEHIKTFIKTISM